MGRLTSAPRVAPSPYVGVSVMENKIFKDCVHGHLSFGRLLVKIIDTPEFQRLRNIKQLGFAYYVYPAASHNRFEHSLGTCHLAGKLLDVLSNSYEVKKKDKLCVQIAALCHDMGHGPFSHTWERFLAAEGIEWVHELSSVELLERVRNYEDVKKEFDENGLGPEEIAFIKSLMIGDYKSNNDPQKHFLYQIVCNKDNDIDVDKWDYLARDKMMLNLPMSFDVGRLFDFCQVLPVERKPKGGIRTEICFRDKEVSNIFDMLTTRASLHEKAYQHRAVKLIEAMMVDALHYANEDAPELRLTDTSGGNLVNLTDHLFYVLKLDNRLKRSRKIIDRIERRQMYKILHICRLDGQLLRDSATGKLNFRLMSGEIYSILKQSNENLQEDEIGADNITVTMGSASKEKTVPDVHIFKKNSKQALPLKKKDVHHLLSQNLTRSVLRNDILVFYKGLDNIAADSFSNDCWDQVDLIIKGHCKEQFGTGNGVIEPSNVLPSGSSS